MNNMHTEITKEEVIRLIRIFEEFVNNPDKNKKIPEELKPSRFNSKLPMFFVGVFFHLLLWLICKCSMKARLYQLSIWSAKKRIEYDKFWYEPVSCGLTNSYTDLGTAYFKAGQIEKATDCLSKSWKVFPCPHNTSFGPATSLCRLLSEHPSSKNAVDEYLNMRKKFRSR